MRTMCKKAQIRFLCDSMINLTKRERVARVMSDSYYSAAELYIIFLKRSKWGLEMKGPY